MADSKTDREFTDPDPGGLSLSQGPSDRQIPPEPELSDAEILDELFESPEHGWPIFWRAFSETIVRRVRRFRLSAEDSADSIQEVSLKLIQEDYRLLRQWDIERGCLKGYLTVIAQSVVLDFLRSPFHRYAAVRAPLDETNGQPQKHGALGVAESGANPRNWAEKRETLRKLSACLEKLSESSTVKPKDLALVRMRLMGMRFREIAEIIGTTESNASTRFTRLLPKFRVFFEESGIDWSDLSEL